jgi:hypothetical protein
MLRPDRDPREVVLSALFESRDTYRKNADDPEQDRWYRGLREHLEADPPGRMARLLPPTSPLLALCSERSTAVGAQEFVLDSPRTGFNYRR